MARTYEKFIRVMVDDQTKELLDTISAQTGEAKSETIRRILLQGLDIHMAENAENKVSKQVQMAIDNHMDRHSKAVKTLISKVAISSYTVGYLLEYFLERTLKLSEEEMDELYVEARKQAVRDVKDRLLKAMDDEA